MAAIDGQIGSLDAPEAVANAQDVPLWYAIVRQFEHQALHHMRSAQLLELHADACCKRSPRRGAHVQYAGAPNKRHHGHWLRGQQGCPWPKEQWLALSWILTQPHVLMLKVAAPHALTAMTSFRPGHKPPHVTMAHCTCLGSWYTSSRAPARMAHGGSGACSCSIDASIQFCLSLPLAWCVDCPSTRPSGFMYCAAPCGQCKGGGRGEYNKHI